MDLVGRLVVVLVLVLAGLAVTAWYRRRKAGDEALGAVDDTGQERWPRLPDQLRHGPDEADPPATWIIFSTPLCVSCGAVQADLEANFPHHRVRKVDATEQPDLADLYEVRRAPTTILADGDGRIVERLVGLEAVREFVGTVDDPAVAGRPADPA